MLRLAAFALGKDFSYADDRDYAMLEGGVQLLVDDFVGLGEVLAALRVANQGMRSADGEELAHRGFAGVSTLFGKVDVLCADGDVAEIAGSSQGLKSANWNCLSK